MSSKYAFDAVIFDLDGVITKTASVHSRAWKKMFDEYLHHRASQNSEKFFEFTPADYLAYVDGKPRYEGVKSFLESRNIELPFGSPEDGNHLETVCGLGNNKNEAFNAVLKSEGVEAYPSTVKLLETLKKDGIRIGVASSSKNCEAVLNAAGLMHFVETRVDGVVSAEMGLKGKPQPDIFLTAAKNLGVDPARSIVVEDAVSGVQAGKNGNFGLVLGLAREENIEALKANGADIVVEDLEEITLDEINDWFINGIDADNWKLAYNDYDPSKEKSREALLAVGNGFFGTRGAMEESKAGKSNYPGTYIAGLYNRLITPIAGRDVENEDFVNAPNWLTIRFKIDDEPWFNPNKTEFLQISRTIDFKTGLLSKTMVVKDGEGRQTRIESERMASMANPHLAGIKYKLTPLNYEGQLSICSSLDGTIINEGVERYKSLNSKHLEAVEQGGNGKISFLVVRTNQSKISIAVASKLNFIGNKNHVKYGVTSDEGIVYTITEHKAEKDKVIEFEKLASIHTSQNEEGNLKETAIEQVEIVDSFDSLLEESTAVWERIWEKVDIQVEGDRISQKLLRMHIYHLMISASPHNEMLDASVTARGLHGEAYRGHIFWDELFILPFYNIHFPKIARSLLMYRYNRLQKAREYAKEYGFKGAMFPWQSGSDGREETQVVHLNPLNGEWGPDHSALQRHVSLAVAYDVYQYFHTTNDVEFIEKYGAEMYFEICRFWASKAELDAKTGKYSIAKVMGPDEFHEMYPGDEEGGLKDNAYTNLMVSWMFSKVPELLAKISSSSKENIFNKIKLSETETKHWEDISSKLRLVISEEGIIAQYDGYFELKELDWNYFRKKYGNIYRMDRLLKAEGKSADDYKVAKQADTLMTFYNLNKETVDSLLSKMGYQLPADYLEKNLNYYLQRTSHGSTLSRVVHTTLANMVGNKELGWELYSDALSSDFNDIQGGTTGEGIHAGVMAGTVLIAINLFAGVDLSGDTVAINPDLPVAWKSMQLNFDFRGVNFQFKAEKNQVVISANKVSEAIVKGKSVKLEAGKEMVIS